MTENKVGSGGEVFLSCTDTQQDPRRPWGIHGVPCSISESHFLLFPVTWALFGFGLGEEFLLHSQAVLPELWSLKYHVSWYCLGGPGSDRINISLSLLWLVLAERGTQAGQIPQGPSQHWSPALWWVLSLIGCPRSNIGLHGLPGVSHLPSFSSCLTHWWIFEELLFEGL